MNFHLLNLISFSNLVFLANFIPFGQTINSMLFFCNVMALVATLVMAFVNPTYQSSRWKFASPLRSVPLFFFNLIVVGIHFIPILLFHHRQNIITPFIILGGWLLSYAYFLVMKKRITELYSFSRDQLAVISISLVSLALILYFFCSQQYIYAHYFEDKALGLQV
jgi:hypothetical protein